MEGMKKYSLSLIEVAIAMTFAAILIGILFYTQTNMATAQAKVEKAKTVVLDRQRLLLRLNQILNSETHFNFANNRLILKYDNGIDYDRKFSGRVTSMLYLEDGKVCLSTWGETDIWRADVLMEGIKTLSFQFFDSEKNTWSDVLPEKPCTMLKLIIDNQEVFPFFL